jgi:HPt (histidine-containing phosphotransfer) domain-containing protein
MLDLKELAKKLKLELSDFEMLLQLFLESTQVSLANIEDALDSNNYKIIKLEARNIKIGATNLMLNEIYDISDKLESASKNNQKINYLTLYTKLESMIEEISLFSHENV